jgi:hypothetical protein
VRGEKCRVGKARPSNVRFLARAKGRLGRQ